MTSLHLCFLPFLLLPFLASAQQKPLFNVADPYKNSTYGDQRINQMKWKDLKSIMMATGDEQIVRNMRKISGKRAAGVTGIWIGNLAMAGGIALMLADSDGATGLLLGGAGIMVVGAAAGSGQKGLMKRSMLRYNEVAGGISFTPGATLIDGQAGFGGMLTLRF